MHRIRSKTTGAAAPLAALGRRPRSRQKVAVGGALAAVAASLLIGRLSASEPRQQEMDFTHGEPLQGAHLPGAWHTFANGDDVLSLALEGTVLWAGTRYGGLVRWDTATGDYIQYLRPQDPIADNTVRDIAIDADGRKWLATPRGLSVFDDAGTIAPGDDSWYTYTTDNSFGGLPSEDVWAVAIRSGEVWVGAHQIQDLATGAWSAGGLGRLTFGTTPGDADDTWIAVITYEETRRTLPNGSQKLGLVSDNVNTLAFTPAGRLWIGSAPFRIFDDENDEWPAVHGGLSALDTKSTPSIADDTWSAFSCEDSPLTVSCYVVDLGLDEDGWMWAATRGRGLLFFQASGDFLGSEGDQRYTEADGLPDNDIRGVAFGPPGSDQVLVATPSGVGVLDHAGTLRNRNDDAIEILDAEGGLARDAAQSVAAAAGGGAWVGTGPVHGVGGGVNKITLDAPAVTAHLATSAEFGGNGPPSNFITDIAFGADGSRWADHVWLAFGSQEQRLFGHGAASVDTQGTSAAADDVWTLYTAVGTDLDHKLPWTGLAGDNVHAIEMDGDKVWLGAASTIWNSDTRSYEDGGLSVYDGTKWTVRTVATSDLRQNNVGSLARGCDGRLWIGLGADFESGLGVDILTAPAIHTLSSDTWSAVRFPSLASDQVTHISIDCNQPHVWAAGTDQFRAGRYSDGGAARQDGAGTWTVYDTTNGLESYASGGVKAESTTVLAGPNGRAWVGTYGTDATTNQALIQTRPYWPAVVNSLEGSTWTSQVFQGAGWVSSLAQDSDGQLWAGLTRGGAARESIDPEGWIQDRTVPGMALRDESGWEILDPITSGVVANDTSTIAVDPDGNVWVGTEGWGLAVYRPHEAAPTPTAISGAPSPTPTATRTATTPATPSASPTGTRRTPTPTVMVTPGPREEYAFLPAVFQTARR